MSWSLPKLPGYSFRDVTQANFNVPRKIDYVNGFPIVRCDSRAIGGNLQDVDGSNFANIADENKLNLSDVYGKVQEDYVPISKPHWVYYDKKQLIFKGYFKQSFPDCLPDDIAVRKVIVIYYLEDDTLTIIEPHIKNSGLMQGKLVKRDKIMKNDNGDFWHWKDFNIGMEISIFGHNIQIVSCDDFTREFMKSQGLDLLENKEIPGDQISQDTQEFHRKNPEVKLMNYKCFLEDDGTTLQFDAVWDDSQSEHGEIRNYKILYFPYNSNFAIRECHEKNGGRDPFPMLLRKMRVPKKWNKRYVNSSIFGQEQSTEDEEIYCEKDLLIGETINILGRYFLLCDCDDFTRRYFKNVLNIEQGTPIQCLQKEVKIPPMSIGPHIGIGDPEDTFMSCLSFHSKPPYKDVVQYNLNSNKNFRYLCEMVSIYPENQGRNFVLLYNLADSTIRIDELPSKNSGVMAGRFSGPSKIPLPDKKPGFYSPEHFYIGEIIVVKNHKLRIISADLYVYHYMKDNPEKFSSEIVENIRNYHLKCGNLNEAEIMLENEETAGIDTQLKDMNINEDIQPTSSEDALLIGWKPTELPDPLREMTCARTLPEDSEVNTEENQPIVCLTGPILENHETSDQINQVQEASQIDPTDYKYDLDEKLLDNIRVNTPLPIAPAKKVSFNISDDK